MWWGSGEIPSIFHKVNPNPLFLTERKDTPRHPQSKRATLFIKLIPHFSTFSFRILPIHGETTLRLLRPYSTFKFRLGEMVTGPEGGFVVSGRCSQVLRGETTAKCVWVPPSPPALTISQVPL